MYTYTETRVIGAPIRVKYARNASILELLLPQILTVMVGDDASDVYHDAETHAYIIEIITLGVYVKFSDTFSKGSMAQG